MKKSSSFAASVNTKTKWSVDADVPPVPKTKICHFVGRNIEKYIKGIQAVRIELLFILKVANIRCFILIKCSEQEARFKKYVIMSWYLVKMTFKIGNT